MNRQFDRKGAKKELWDEDETEEKREERWNPGYHYENPETAYIRKETLREQLDKLTDKQREVFRFTISMDIHNRRLRRCWGLRSR